MFSTLYNSDMSSRSDAELRDPSVGCATGRVTYVDGAQSSVGHGTRYYWSYEFLLKKHESNVCSLIGVCGCLYAVRRSAYIPLYLEACSDFIIATKMVEQGLRAVYEPQAVCTEELNQKADKELKTRVRIITQTFSTSGAIEFMMNPFRSGFYAVELLSHKVMRYVVPLFLIATSGYFFGLAPHSIVFTPCSPAQIAFYFSAALAWLLEQ